jgi:hypothetical protein
VHDDGCAGCCCWPGCVGSMARRRGGPLCAGDVAGCSTTTSFGSVMRWQRARRWPSRPRSRIRAGTQARTPTSTRRMGPNLPSRLAYHSVLASRGRCVAVVRAACCHICARTRRGRATSALLARDWSAAAPHRRCACAPRGRRRCSNLAIRGPSSSSVHTFSPSPTTTPCVAGFSPGHMRPLGECPRALTRPPSYGPHAPTPSSLCSHATPELWAP